MYYRATELVFNIILHPMTFILLTLLFFHLRDRLPNAYSRKAFRYNGIAYACVGAGVLRALQIIWVGVWQQLIDNGTVVL